MAVRKRHDIQLYRQQPPRIGAKRTVEGIPRLKAAYRPLRARGISYCKLQSTPLSGITSR